jgi:hypothetical protein
MSGHGCPPMSARPPAEDPSHPALQAQELAWLRGLIVQIAEGLERLAAVHEADRAKLAEAAMWLRRQLHRGPPPAGPVEGMGVGRGPTTSETAPPRTTRR